MRERYHSVRPFVVDEIRQIVRSSPDLQADGTTIDIVRAAQTAAFAVAAAIHAQAQELHTMTAELRQLSLTDPVTGLDNRNGYEKNVRESFETALRNDMPVTVVTLDLNDIDVINALQGRREGDRWIQTTADILRSSCARRPSRWGGDEYGVILLGTNQPESQDWWQGIQHQFDDAGIRISAGAATFLPGVDETDAGKAIAQTHREADVALYAAKTFAKELDISMFLNYETYLATPGQETHI